ncbi:hypothetical protein LSTR_LSTR009564 [Laodelphax striatellus]|uniref:EF-hand domain-containing protein n=1 Tax=Laodelphax striatellus TaxID=195883 RepID=A0A482WSM2_LAOST|nr:hypothetical protein LSTR_LSTR009564 [Laodelphax striatellus]
MNQDCRRTVAAKKQDCRRSPVCHHAPSETLRDVCFAAGKENKYSNDVFDANGDGQVCADDLETCAAGNHDKFETNWPTGALGDHSDRDRILDILNDMVANGPIVVDSAALQRRFSRRG